MKRIVTGNMPLLLTALEENGVNIPVVLVVAGCIILCSVVIIIVNGRSKRK